MFIWYNKVTPTLYIQYNVCPNIVVIFERYVTAGDATYDVPNVEYFWMDSDVSCSDFRITKGFTSKEMSHC